MERTEVRFAGYGGQGVITAGVFLGTAVVLHDGNHAVQTQSYGAAARGGAARSDVIVSGTEIVYPQVVAPDIMVAFTNEALAKYRGDMRPDGVLILDEDLVEPPEGTEFGIYRVPATRIATNELGKSIVANMIMLGYLAALTDVAGIEGLGKVIAENVPKGTEKLNMTAFERGVSEARAVRAG